MIDPQALYSTNGQEAWRVLGIMAEFQMAADRLNGVRPAVSMFGSARVSADHPYYQIAQMIARKLSDAGFSVISGGGPGIMEAANHGAHAGRAPAIGLNIVLPNEQASSQYQDIILNFLTLSYYLIFGRKYLLQVCQPNAHIFTVLKNLAEWK